MMMDSLKLIRSLEDVWRKRGVDLHKVGFKQVPGYGGRRVIIDGGHVAQSARPYPDSNEKAVDHDRKEGVY